MPLLFWFPLIIFSGLFGMPSVSAEQTHEPVRTVKPRYTWL
jgi:hypothetical protein